MGKEFWIYTILGFLSGVAVQLALQLLAGRSWERSGVMRERVVIFAGFALSVCVYVVCLSIAAHYLWERISQ